MAFDSLEQVSIYKLNCSINAWLIIQRYLYNNFRVNHNNDFSSNFHTYRVEWLSSGMKFFIDNEMIGNMPAPSGGFWKKGGFNGQNIWSGSSMAPFDQKVYWLII